MSPRVSGGGGALQHLGSSSVAPRAVRECVATVVSHQVRGSLLWRPRETNARRNLRLDCEHLAASLCLHSSLLYPAPNLDPALHQRWQTLGRLCGGLAKAAVLGQMGLGLPQGQEGEEHGICWMDVMENGIHRSTSEASSRLAALGTGLETHTLSIPWQQGRRNCEPVLTPPP